MGIRMSAGHAVFHLAAFVTMLMIDPLKTHAVPIDEVKQTDEDHYHS